jgi:DNA mismatch endonuclease (patch repair protein)
LLGNPDFVFQKERVIVFVDGCFWHGCREHSRVPKSNVAYWRTKLQRNVQRDRRNNRALRSRGWNVIRFWQHSLAREDIVVKRVLAALSEAKR